MALQVLNFKSTSKRIRAPENDKKAKVKVTDARDSSFFRRFVVHGENENQNMKYLRAITLIFALVMITSAMSHAQKKGDGKNQLRHVVLVKFKDTSTEKDVKSVEEAFAGLAKKISLIRGFEWGTNNSPENLDQGLTHCFFLTFSSEKDRDDYLVHPEHKAFVDQVGPHLDKVTVVDYWVKK